MGDIAGYTLIDKIGEGGMATVYKGMQVSLNRPVAIKVLSKNLAQHPVLLERFSRESLIIARLTHPHIIHVIDRGLTDAGMPYFIMEFVEGTDLAAIIREGNPDFNRKLDLVIQVCKALSYAHKNGVIHRDIKPSNVLIDTDGNARVLDFGIAQFYAERSGDATRTQTGVIMGTLPYMSPEQQSGSDNVTALSDIYSLGALSYELFTGRKPLGRFKMPCEINPELPKVLEDVIISCLEPEPANRPASADEIKDRLLKMLQGAHLRSTQRERASQGIARIEDKFALLDVIKDNRYGAVYLYEDRLTNTLLIIKKQPSIGRGLTEAKLLTSLKHKNIVNILGASKDERNFIIVMEYISGGSLKDRLIRPFPVQDVLRIGMEICGGLAFAHRNRIIHGNIRPSNILFTESGQVKIADFGLDEHYGQEPGVQNWYRLEGEPPTPAGDVFAAGMILYQMMSGVLPEWEGGRLILHENPARYPFELQELVSRMVVRKLAGRESSFEQIMTELESIQARFDRTIMMKTGTDEDSAAQKDRAHQGLRQSGVWRLVWMFIVLVIVSAAASGYLIQTGDMQKYVEFILSFFQKLGINLR